MTDNEIMIALRRCAEHGKEYFRQTIAALAWDLMYRQKAEIERLQKEKDFEQYEKTRLRLLFKGEYDNNKKVKSEAIKEFAERLKEEATVDDDSTWWVANIDIDNLVKEMTEGKE